MKKWLALAAFLIGCASPPPPRAPAPVFAGQVYEISIDPTFSAARKKLILTALDTWAEYANGLVNYEAVFKPDGPYDIENVDGTNRVIIESDNRVQSKCLRCRVLGTTDGEAPHRVRLVNDRIKDDVIFLQVALHEIGHKMGLDHTNDAEGIMPLVSTEDGATCPHRSDMVEFCAARGCFLSQVHWCR